MRACVVYLHGKGGSAAEKAHYKPLFPERDVIGFDYHAAAPWEAAEEFPAYFDALREKYTRVSLIANSIGAFFAMSAQLDAYIDRAFFLSPIVDMEKLIADLLAWAGKSEAELRERGSIPTEFGETLSWDYLSYVRAHPLSWSAPTDILYGGRDALTSLETVSAFARRCGARLTVMADGEHWFHTDAQLRFLDDWLRACLKN